jgi:Glycosyl transferase family 11
MITCNLQGGLGNQLFQIYTTIAYAMETQNSFFFLDIYILKNVLTNRHTYWDTFLVSLKPFIKNPDIIQNLVHIKEQNFSYNPIKNKYDPSTMKMLVGYFQSYKYFELYSSVIYRLLKIDNFKIQLTNKYSELINDDQPISIHFRIGDYKKEPEYYIILGEDYYKKALNHILELIQPNKKVKVLYFCEDQDLEYVDTIITILKQECLQVIFERADPELDDWEQLILMSLCRHSIIANSTFSWWGAYLNTHRNKKVLYPLAWFGPKANHNTSDMFPTNWIPIE